MGKGVLRGETEGRACCRCRIGFGASGDSRSRPANGGEGGGGAEDGPSCDGCSHVVRRNKTYWGLGSVQQGFWFWSGNIDIFGPLVFNLF